jgi:hypothetical protein
MIGAIPCTFDIDHIRRLSRVDYCDGLISRDGHKCHGRGRQDSGEDGGNGGAHGALR